MQPNPDQSLRVFLIGAGHIARDHARTARKIALHEKLNLELFVADPFEAARNSFGKDFPEAQLFADAREMLALPSHAGDIVVVATPPFLHREGAVMALDSGRDTLVEKPIAPTWDDALAIDEAARSNGKIWGDCSMRLYAQPSTRELKTRLADGEIGTPYHVRHIYKGDWGRPGIEYQPASKWFLDKSKAGGGILMDWAVYDLANLVFLLEPKRVEIIQAWQRTPETSADPKDVPFDVETHIGATMKWTLANQTEIILDYERASGTYGKAQQLSEIEGTRGAFEWNWAWNYQTTGVKRSYEDGKTIEEPLDFVDEREKEWDISQGERPLIAFYRTTRGENVPALVGPAALWNFELLMALARAAETSERGLVIEKA